jgi:cystathionine beta-lyase
MSIKDQSNHQPGRNSLAVHAGTVHDDVFGGVNTPIYTSTSIDYRVECGPVPYPRNFSIPNHNAVAQKIAALEGGEACLVLSTGMSAIIIGILAIAKPGDHILMQSNIYGGTLASVKILKEFHNISVTLIDSMDIDTLSQSIMAETVLLYLETPTNPLLDIIDIQQMTEWARDNRILTMIDNTFASPINQQPLQLGCDIVMHSATKYLGGHSDIMAGALIGNATYIEKCRSIASIYGMSLNAMDLALLERSIKTVGIRVKQQNENALQVAQWLSNNPMIEKVYYPGLEDHPGHDIARKQMLGFGGMLSFALKSRDIAQRDAFLNALSMIAVAGSLAGVESTITVPAETSHSLLTKEQRASMGIHNSLLRLSIGIEDAADIIHDLERALQ